MFPLRSLIILSLFLAPLSFGDARLTQLKRQLAIAGKQCRSQEKLCTVSNKRLSQLEAEKMEKTGSLKMKILRINMCLSALNRIQRQAPSTLLHVALKPQQLVQSVIALNAFIRRMLKAAKDLDIQIRAIESLKLSIENEKTSSRMLAKQFKEKHRKLTTLLKERRKVLKREVKKREALQKKANAMAKKSKNVKDLITQMEKPLLLWPRDSIPDNEKRYHMKPVAGPVTSPYGFTHGADLEGCGLVFQAQPNELVYSPVNAKVVYAGPFRDYRDIIILSHDERYHTLIMGFDELDVSLGQYVLAGEPLGYMGEKKPQYLYVELRQDGKSQDPSPWFKGVSS